MEWSDAHNYIFQPPYSRPYLLKDYDPVGKTIKYAICPDEWYDNPNLIDHTDLSWLVWSRPQVTAQCRSSNPKLIVLLTPQERLIKKIHLLESRFKRHQERKQNEMGRCI